MKRIILLLQLFIITTILILSNGCTNSSSIHKISRYSAPTHINHIALLLPLNGPLAPYANAIRHGFFAAYYDQKRQTGIAPTITVFDTAGKNIHDVYQAAVTQGADFIVGPLDKSDVLALADARQPAVPVLALNTTPSNIRIKNDGLYEFALSPTDEAQQAAQKAYQDHHRNIIILAPNNAWGQRLADAFTQQWKTLGGNIVATQYYGDIASLSKNIQHVLQIDRAYQNEDNLKKQFQESIRFIPDRRQDFDSIFLVATPAMGRQIQPLLRFYFAGNIPVYATSQIYAGKPDPGRDNDLNGISFCDMPWILAPNEMQPPTLQSLQQHIQSLWPDSYNHFAKFYAMGIDAFNLSFQLNQLQSQPQSGMPAATGMLYLTEQHKIYRQLVWAQFKDGAPQLTN